MAHYSSPLFKCLKLNKVVQHSQDSQHFLASQHIRKHSLLQNQDIYSPSKVETLKLNGRNLSLASHGSTQEHPKMASATYTGQLQPQQYPTIRKLTVLSG